MVRRSSFDKLRMTGFKMRKLEGQPGSNSCPLAVSLTFQPSASMALRSSSLLAKFFALRAAAR